MINKRIFGSDISPKVKQKLEYRQAYAKSAEPGESLAAIDEKYHIESLEYKSTYDGIADLSSRTPFVRMWTAVQLSKSEELKVGDYDPKKLKDDEYQDPIDEKFYAYKKLDTETIYVVGNHVLTTIETTPNTSLSAIMPNELEKNKFLKPPAGIISISSTTEGTLGVIRKTTVNFVVNNFNDYDKIYSRYFIRPGAQIFVDFGWNTANLYDPESLIKNSGLPDEKSKLRDISVDAVLYGDSDDGDVANGYVTDARGDMETLVGFVTNYDAKIKDNGSVECSLEITSKNQALLGQSLTSAGNLPLRINKALDKELVQYALGRAGIKNYKVPATDDGGYDADTKKFIDENLSSKILLPSGDAVKWGVFVKNNQFYISYGLFEDLILNPNLGFGENEADINVSEKSMRFDSSDSYVTYDKSFFNSQKVCETTKVMLYPDAWDNTYNTALGKTPIPGYFGVSQGSDEDFFGGNITAAEYKKAYIARKSVKKEGKEKKEESFQPTKFDKSQRRIPLREIFINTKHIKDAFGGEADNITDVLKKIINGIADSTNLNLKISNNGDDKIISLVDINLPYFESNGVEEDNTFKNLFVFKPGSPSSIVKSFDISFSMPQNNIGNMIAIQSTSSTKKIFPISAVIDQALGLESLETILKLGDDAESKIERISVGYIPDIGNFRAKKLAEAASEDAKFEFNFNRTYNILAGSVEAEKERQETLVVSPDSNTVEQTLSDGYMGNLLKNLGKNSKHEFASGKGPPPITEDDANLSVYEEEKAGYKVASSLDDYYEKESKIASYVDSSQRNNSTILPLTLNLGIYGISSIVPGDIFKVDYLPERYRNLVYFQIMKVSHDINASTWTTKFDTQFRIRRDVKLLGGLYAKPAGVVLDKKILKEQLKLAHIERVYTNFRQLRPDTSADDALPVFTFKALETFEWKDASPVWPVLFYGTSRDTQFGETHTKSKFGNQLGDGWVGDVNAINIGKEAFNYIIKNVKNFPWLNYKKVEFTHNGDSTSYYTTGRKYEFILFEPHIKLEEGKSYQLITNKDKWFILPDDPASYPGDALANQNLHREKIGEIARKILFRLNRGTKLKSQKKESGVSEAKKYKTELNECPNCEKYDETMCLKYNRANYCYWETEWSWEHKFNHCAPKPCCDTFSCND